MITRELAVIRQKILLSLLLTAGVGLAGCSKSPADRQADVVRQTSEQRADTMDNQADAVEKSGANTGEAVKSNAEVKADAIHDQADNVRDQGKADAQAIKDNK
jgi:uncharacterized membrane protein YqiK